MAGAAGRVRGGDGLTINAANDRMLYRLGSYSTYPSDGPGLRADRRAQARLSDRSRPVGRAEDKRADHGGYDDHTDRYAALGLQPHELGEMLALAINHRPLRWLSW